MIAPLRERNTKVTSGHVNNPGKVCVWDSLLCLPPLQNNEHLTQSLLPAQDLESISLLAKKRNQHPPTNLNVL